MMTVSAHDVAAQIRARMPGVGAKKLHKLLYFCQGHHLAWFGEPLFAEPISAWDMGPVVGSLWRHERDAGAPSDVVAVDEAALNTVGYVLSRYGKSTGGDLQRLTHSSSGPWSVSYGGPGTDEKIPTGVMAAYFRRIDDEDDEELRVDPALVREHLKGVADRALLPGKPDSVESLRARVRDLAAAAGRRAERA